MGTEEREINVNELIEILTKHFQQQVYLIPYVEVADIRRQHRPRKSHVGIGGILNIKIILDT